MVQATKYKCLNMSNNSLKSRVENEAYKTEPKGVWKPM